MDACFLSPNSLTMEVVPRISRKIFNQRQIRRSRVSFSVSCSQSDSTSASPQREETPVLSADWRTFRARLLARERTSSSRQPSLMLDPYASIDQPLPIPIEDKWAHPIHEPEKGCLLIATEKHDGNHIYEKTVILLLSTGQMGLTGLILNTPSFMSIKDMRSWALKVSGTFYDRPLFFGGPLMEGLFLVSPKQEKNGFKKGGVLDEVMKGLYYGTKESVGCAAEVGDFRFFDGYCAWEREELRNEISAGYWSLAACSPSVLGLNSVESVGLWEEVNGLMGHRKVC